MIKNSFETRIGTRQNIRHVEIAKIKNQKMRVKNRRASRKSWKNCLPSETEENKITGTFLGIHFSKDNEKLSKNKKSNS